jgi:two-component system sensor histidine kinase/response regulator
MADGASAFNVQDALKRLMNNKNLYKKVLDKFGASGYDDYDQKIRAAFDADNFEDATHLSHTMKGVAGNVGATDLQAASLALEMIAKGGAKTADLGGALDKFSAELKRALAEVAAGVDMG